MLCPQIERQKAQSVKVNACLTKLSGIARKEVERVVKDSGASSDQQLQKILAKKAKSILAMSACCQVELSLFDSLVGKTSENRLIASVSGFFPTADEAAPPELVGQKLTTLMKSQAFTFASTTAQNKVRTVQKWLNRVIGDLPPDLDLAKDCELLLTISSKFQFFCRLMVEEEAKPGKKAKAFKQLIGKPALVAMYDQCKQALDEGTATLADATPLAVWKYLADDELKANIEALISGIDEDLVKKGGAPAGIAASASKPGTSGSAASKGKKKGKDAKKDDDEDNSHAVKKCMSLFGC